MARITKTYELNPEKEFEQLDWQAGLSDKEQRMLAVYGNIKDVNEKKHILANIRRLNKLNSELQTINSKIDLIDSLKDSDIEKTKLRLAIKDILREKNILVQFEVVSKKWTTKQQEILKWKNIDTISARDLLSAENEEAGFLSKAFAYKITKDTSGEESETPLIKNDIKEKDIIKIDFGKNKWANARVGAGDILPNSVKTVKITDDKGHTRIWLRSIWKDWKVGYFDESGYIAIFNNYLIEVPSNDEEKSIISNLSKDITISSDENAEKEAKLKYAQEMWQDDEFFAGLKDKYKNIDNWENLSWKALEANPEFQSALDYIAKKLQANKSDLLTVMYAESELNPKATNPYSNATGLIQFVPGTAAWLGTSVEELRTMTSIEQLEYVYKYFKPYTGKLNWVTDLYAATFYPRALGKWDDYKMWWELVAKQNQVIAKYCDNSNQIDYAGFKKYVEAKTVEFRA